MDKKRIDQLPSEETIVSQRKQVLWVWAGAALLFLIVNYGVGLYQKNTFSLQWLIQSKWAALTQRTAPVDWLIVGDSSGLMGLDPKILEGNLGGTSFNFCTFAAAGVENATWMLEWHVKHLGAPKGVLLMVMPRTWTNKDLSKSWPKVPLPFWEWAQLRPLPNHWKRMAVEIILLRWFPLYSMNIRIPSLIQHGWSHNNGIETRYENGFYMQIKPPNADSKPRELNVFINPDFEIVPEAKELFNRMAAIAEKEHFDLFLVLPPYQEYLTSREKFDALLANPAIQVNLLGPNQINWKSEDVFDDVQVTRAQIEGALRALAAKSPHVHFLTKGAARPLAEFKDEDHLYLYGAEAFTQDKVIEIAEIRRGRN